MTGTKMSIRSNRNRQEGMYVDERSQNRKIRTIVNLSSTRSLAERSSKRDECKSLSSEEPDMADRRIT